MTVNRPSQSVAVYDRYQPEWPVVQQEMPRFMDMGFFGNVWIRSMSFAEPGESYRGHKHQFDHMSLLTKGRVALRVGTTWYEYQAPSFVEIRKDDEHEIVALEPSDWWCVSAVRDDVEQVVERADPTIHDPLRFAL